MCIQLHFTCRLLLWQVTSNSTLTTCTYNSMIVTHNYAYSSNLRSAWLAKRATKSSSFNVIGMSRFTAAKISACSRPWPIVERGLDLTVLRNRAWWLAGSVALCTADTVECTSMAPARTLSATQHSRPRWETGDLLVTTDWQPYPRRLCCNSPPSALKYRSSKHAESVRSDGKRSFSSVVSLSSTAADQHQRSAVWHRGRRINTQIATDLSGSSAEEA